MGCPVPKVVKNGDGAALMKNPDLVYDIVYAVVKNSEKPVTVKIRKGFDEESINAVEVARPYQVQGHLLLQFTGEHGNNTIQAMLTGIS